jgi:RNA polymerase sigma-70 factor (ECF subfamily)
LQTLNKALQSHITGELIEGNIKAFEAVFNHYYNGLIYFATSYLKNREDANDIIQSVFLTLWERRASLHQDTNLMAYLFTNTRNLCLNYLNHLKARSNYLSFQEHSWNDLQLNIYALEEFNPSSLEYDELEKKLQKALDTMPDDSAKIFRMSRFDGLKYSEIAEKLHVSVKTVEKKMSIALSHLRIELKGFLFLLFISNI